MKFKREVPACSKKSMSFLVLEQLPPKKISPNPKTNPNREQFSLGAIVCLPPPTLKLTLTLTQTLALTGMKFSSVSNCPDTEFSDFLPPEKVQFTFCTKSLLRFVWSKCFFCCSELDCKLLLRWILDDRDDTR